MPYRLAFLFDFRLFQQQTWYKKMLRCSPPIGSKEVRPSLTWSDFPNVLHYPAPK